MLGQNHHSWPERNAMWNQALRRVVHAEERQQEERRRQQLALAASVASSTSKDVSPAPEVATEAAQLAVEGEKPTTGEDAAAVEAPKGDSEAPDSKNDTPHVEEEEGYLQKHLLSRPTAAWSCLEDTQQANCLALNASQTLVAVGERDGRVTIWDNTTVRVITRELDPTLIALPAEASEGAKTGDGQKNGTAKAADGAKKPTPDAEGSIENDDASVEDDEEERTEDAASVEDIATEEEEEVEEDTHEESEETKTEDEADTVESGTVLTLADLRVVKTALKVVSQCAWSCDSRWLFAGCEEKSTRRASGSGRLCVWNVEAATLVSAFRFDGTITSLSAHPCDPNVVVVSFWNSRPVLLDVISGERTELQSVPLENTEVTQPTPQNSSRHPTLASCARYGRSGKRIYCATSKSTLAVLDAVTLQCLDSLKLNVIIQFVDLCVNVRETAMLLTSSKGIHEFAMNPAVEAPAAESEWVEVPATATEEHPLGLRELALHSTGAVRAPWAVCCFSGGEEFVVGTPVVRHRHVGENGLFTWHRASALGKTTAQHNAGVKDGVLALAWDRMRQSVLAVSTSGALHVLEEQFTTTWPGAMYPAGFRLITDNELHLDAFDRDAEERKREKERLAEDAKHAPVDVFTVQSPSVEFPGDVSVTGAELPKSEFENPRYVPAIPIAYYHRRHLHQLTGAVYNEEKHFGLGQSVFEPLKGALGKQKKANSRKSKGGNKRSQKKRRR
jgi:COMPASS component SWD1